MCVFESHLIFDIDESQLTSFYLRLGFKQGVHRLRRRSVGGLREDPVRGKLGRVLDAVRGLVRRALLCQGGHSQDRMGPGAAGGREISSELAKRPRGRDARGQGHPCHAPVRRPGEDRQKGRRPGGAIRLGGRPRALVDVEGRDIGRQGAGHEAPRARHRGHVRPRRERGPEPRHADDRVRDLHGPLRHPVRGVHRRRADAGARGGAGSGARLRAPAPRSPEPRRVNRHQAARLDGSVHSMIRGLLPPS
mmetsp:Transcript_14465/g.32712  ORF Transcript_14465/g.32712 Transcript_14465/m.32712 type:complete len:249 (-) Transcript_14465:417-1163(-)